MKMSPGQPRRHRAISVKMMMVMMDDDHVMMVGVEDAMQRPRVRDTGSHEGCRHEAGRNDLAHDVSFEC